MNLSELKEKLYEYNVPEHWYSLDDGLKPDAVIIYKNYSKWECFYLSERGDRDYEETFSIDSDAYEYLWKMMESQLKTFKILPREK